MIGKRGAGSPWPWIVLAIAAMFLFYPYIVKLFPGTTTPTTPTTPTQPGYICPVDTVKVTFAPEDKENPGTLVYVNARLWVAGVPQGVVNTSDEKIVSPDDTLQVWFGAGDATYYGNLFNTNSKVPCKGTYSVPGILYSKDTGVEVTMFDENNKAIGTEVNITMDPGAEETVTLRVKGHYQEYLGNPAVDLKNLLTAEYSPTEVSEVKVFLAGTKLEEHSVPLVESVGTAGNKELGFLMDKVTGSGKVDYDVTVRADNINDPDPGDVIEFKIYDADFFYNSDTGKIDKGWEDENHDDIGVSAEPTATLYME